MSKTFDFIVGTDRIKKSIEEITEEETEGKTSLGLTVGMDIGGCLCTAARHYKNFWKDVKYYRVCDKEEVLKEEGEVLDPRCSTVIEFYK